MTTQYKYKDQTLTLDDSKRASKKVEIGVEIQRHDKGVGRNLGV